MRGSHLFMRSRFWVISIILFIFLAVVGLRVFNESLPGTIVSPRFFLSQVSPGPNQALFFYQPASGNIITNSTFVVDIRVNSSVAITSVKAYPAFDPARLSVVSIDSSTSAFGTQWEQTFDNAAGNVRLQRSTPAPGLSGDRLIARITFQAKSITGDTAVGYDANCFTASNPSCLALKADDTNVLASSPSATFTIAASDTTPPSAVSLH